MRGRSGCRRCGGRHRPVPRPRQWCGGGRSLSCRLDMRRAAGDTRISEHRAMQKIVQRAHAADRYGVAAPPVTPVTARVLTPRRYPTSGTAPRFMLNWSSDSLAGAAASRRCSGPFNSAGSSSGGNRTDSFRQSRVRKRC